MSCGGRNKGSCYELYTQNVQQERIMGYLHSLWHVLVYRIKADRRPCAIIHTASQQGSKR